MRLMILAALARALLAGVIDAMNSPDPTLAALRGKYLAFERHLTATVRRAMRDHRRTRRRLRAARRGGRVDRLTAFGQASGNLVDTILVIVVSGVIAYVGLQIAADTEDSAEFEANSGFSNASNELTGGFETAFGLIDVVYIALMLSVIIVALVGLRRR